MRRATALLLASATLVLAACGGDEVREEPAGPDFRDIEADQVMVGVEHFMTREGVRRAHLRADTVYLSSEGSSAHLRHYTVDFFNARGGLQSVLTAEDGTYDMRTGDMRATDNVVVVDSDESQRLETEGLLYDATSEKLQSDVAFTLVEGRDTIRGTGFVTDPGLDSLTVRQPAMVSPPDEEAGAPGDTAGGGGPDAEGGGGGPAAGDGAGARGRDRASAPGPSPGGGSDRGGDDARP